MLYLSHIALSSAKMAQIRSIAHVLQADIHVVVPHDTVEITRLQFPEAQVLSDREFGIENLGHEPVKLAHILVTWIASHPVTCVLAPHTPRWQRVLSLASAACQIPYMGGLLPQALPKFQRSISAGKLIETLETPQTAFCATLSGEAIPNASASLSLPKLMASHSPQDRLKVPTLTSWTAFEQDFIRLDAARLVFAGGRGLGSQSAFYKLAQCAQKCGAALAASRLAVDLEWCRNDLQVGQTGLSIAPDVYVAFGISGAIQHIAGIQNARKIIAINTDKDAPIFKFANVGIIADVHEVMDLILAQK